MALHLIPSPPQIACHAKLLGSRVSQLNGYASRAKTKYPETPVLDGTGHGSQSQVLPDTTVFYPRQNRVHHGPHVMETMSEPLEYEALNSAAACRLNHCYIAFESPLLFPLIFTKKDDLNTQFVALLR
jgi:hypothetical protein